MMIRKKTNPRKSHRRAKRKEEKDGIGPYKRKHKGKHLYSILRIASIEL